MIQIPLIIYFVESVMHCLLELATGMFLCFCKRLYSLQYFEIVIAVEQIEILTAVQRTE